MITTFVNAAFYKFVTLTDHEAMKAPILQMMHDLPIKGTIILAEEGINGSFCGTEAAVASMCAHLQSYLGLEDLLFCNTYSEINPFDKAKVKLRKEIVTMGKENVSPSDLKGIYLNPQEWNAMMQDPNVVLIDTRNDYEVSLGSFEGAVNPHTENFRDFPDYVEKHLMDQKDKKIAMYCTGGIRCEKSTAYLKQQGFPEVYHLQGGILNYLAKTSAKDSRWQGSCFVFDDRVALDQQLQSLPQGSIDSEWKNKFKHK